MKKAFDQTVRDLKRGVNKKVLKVPGVEQKVLDATNNESWGPHGTLLADIAQATRSYHDYQMIMHVIWKRINDTGKNWRHVYKALIVLEYLVAHGSERVIEDIREHGYQISILSDFQYVDSSGRDQGSNVRRKSQSLVALVNDKERVQEVRQKSAANRDKYRNAPSNGSPGGYGDYYVDDHSENRYASRDEEQYGNGKERHMGYRDDDRSSRHEVRDGGFSEERHGRDNDLKGHGKDGYQYGSENRNLSRNRSFDDDDCYSSRSGGGSRADDLPQEERQLERRHSPPSYEEATRDAQSHVQEDRNGDGFTADAPKASPPNAISPSEITNPSSTLFAPTDNYPQIADQGLGHAPAGVSSITSNNENNCFDEFDPRGSSVSVSPPVAHNLEMDLFGSNPIYSLATNGSEVDLPANSGPGTGFEAMPSASGIFGQPGENPFGDPAFQAIQENYSYRQVSFGPVTTINSSISTGSTEVQHTAANASETTTGFDFDLYFGVANNPVLDGQQNSFGSSTTPVSEAPVTQQYDNNLGMLSTQKSMENFVSMQEARPAATLHVHGNPLPQSAPPVPFASQGTQFGTQDAPTHTQGNVLPQSGPPAPQATQFSTQDATTHMQGNFLSQSSLPAPFSSQATQFASQDAPTNLQGNFLSQSGPPAAFASHGTEFSTKEPHANQYTSQDTSAHVQGNFQSHSGPPAPFAPQATQFTVQDGTHMQGSFLSQSGPSDPFASYSSQFAAQDAPTHMQRNFLSQSGPPAPFASQPAQFTTKEAPTHVQRNFLPHSSPPAPFASQATQFTPQNGATHIQGNHLIQSSSAAPFASQATQFTAQNAVTPINNQIPQLNLLSQPGLQTSAALVVPDQTPVLQHVKTAPSKEKFEPKSTVWADTLSRGLVNLNISGPKTNPHADIGIDFDSMNRKEKMKEEKKVSATPVSTVSMGKAMGSGSGIGRAGAGALAAPQNPMMGMGMMDAGGGMGMGMGMMGGAGMGMGMGMGGYGGNMGQPMGMGMNMGMNQGMPQRPLTGVPPGASGMPGYNPMMGIGNFGSQQPYGGGYR